MYPQQIHAYLHRFFQENQCVITEDAGNFMRVQLTIEMDKKMMNRPFYWQYVEATGAVPCPAQLTFITDTANVREDVRGEVVHFGSYRLNQVFNVTKQQGSIVHLFEKVRDNGRTKTILTPWVGVNFKVTYASDQTKETLYSLGMNLMTGQIIDGFQESVENKEFDVEMSAHTFNLPYTIKPLRALGRLEGMIIDLIKQDDHQWIDEATNRWKKDQRVLEYFYEGVEHRPESYEVEKKAMEEQYRPKIVIEIINGGLFYVTAIHA